ncbi:MAG: DUF3096 domain-containing protein [Candidatus Roizmanbacteria bacterium]|nr:DUF3096 domain-containing protein [Candidatus Roizmanbacteria bacterium]
MELVINAFNPVVSLVFGILILLFPDSLNYLIALYLILSGLIGLGVLTIG